MTAKKSNRRPTSNKPAAQKPAEPKTEEPRQPAEQGTATDPPADQIVATTPPEAAPPADAPPADQIAATTPPAAGIPRHRRCPICWEGMGGTGKAYSTHGSKTYYRCDCCGHTWTARVTHEATVIEHRTVEIERRSK